MAPIVLDLSDTETPADREGAGFWVRALARVIDTLVHFAVVLGAGFVAGVLVIVGSILHGIPPDVFIAKLSVTGPLGLVAAGIGSLSMHTLAEGIHGSTVGKRLCGLTVISEDGTPATLMGAFQRSIAYLWDALFFGLVAAHKMSESQRRQRFGDVWGRTQVVHVSSIDPGARRSFARFVVATTAGILVDGVVVLVELATKLV